MIRAGSQRRKDASVSNRGLEGPLEVWKGLQSLASTWAEVTPSEAIRRLSLTLLTRHPLRAADAWQLAAALTVARGGRLAVATLDSRLALAAIKEGLPVLP